VSEKPETCYRDAAGGHYIISSESEDGTVQTEHGGDSFAPGMHVNGIPRADLKPCGCGKWTRAHEVQQREGVRMFAAADRLDEAETTEPLRPGHTK
jgi:hypothetical protein